MSSARTELLLLGRVDLISLTTVEGALYGFAFALYIFCAQALYLQLKDRDQHRQHLSSLVYMSLGLVLLLFAVAVDSRNVLLAYVDHADYPGGSFAYLAEVTAQSPISTASNVIGVLLDLTTYGVQIWRLWIVWSGTRYAFFIVVLPVLTLLMNIGFQITSSVFLAQSATTLHLDAVLIYGQASTKLCTSVAITVCIVIRILMVRRKQLRLTSLTDTRSPYTSVISMLIESFALELVWLVPQISLYNVETPGGLIVILFCADTLPYIQLLAYLLVVHRVCTRRGWEQGTGEKLTSLRWNQNGLQTTQTGTQVSVPIAYEEALSTSRRHIPFLGCREIDANGGMTLEATIHTE